MSRPNTTPARTLLLSIIVGRDVSRGTPGWMDRKFGYTPKSAKGGNTKKCRR